MPAGNDEQDASSDLADVLKKIEEHLEAMRAHRDKSPQDWLTVPSSCIGIGPYPVVLLEILND